MVFFTSPRVAIRPANSTALSFISAQCTSFDSRSIADSRSEIKPKRLLISGSNCVSIPASTATSKNGTGTTATPAEYFARFFTSARHCFLTFSKSRSGSILSGNFSISGVVCMAYPF